MPGRFYQLKRVCLTPFKDHYPLNYILEIKYLYSPTPYF